MIEWYVNVMSSRTHVTTKYNTYVEQAPRSLACGAHGEYKSLVKNLHPTRFNPLPSQERRTTGLSSVRTPSTLADVPTGTGGR